VRILALDTTTRSGSVALVDDNTVVEERRGDGSRTHAERLPGEILALLAAHRLAPCDMDVFAVASGPGSFTGLRIGIATVQGLAFVCARPVVGVPALDALAHAATIDAPAGTIVGVWMDAHRHDVFAALYEIVDAPLFVPERLRVVEEPTVGDPASTLERWRRLRALDDAMFIGDGASAFADAIARPFPSARIVPAPLIAGVLGRLAGCAADRGETGDPAAIHPLYVRRPDAEAARDRRVAD
jgi:tRNA threonylcarbamoyladenosine biosynthesis protein TsaB